MKVVFKYNLKVLIKNIVHFLKLTILKLTQFTNKANKYKIITFIIDTSVFSLNRNYRKKSNQ